MDLASIGSRIATDIDEYIVKTADKGHRAHLGASIIGEACSRKLWYTFRWCYTEDFRNPMNEARMMRLFERGHLEEARFIGWLRGIGAEVWTHDTNGEQFRFKDINGHFAGSMDGVTRLPKKYGIDEPILLEFKTSGTGAKFNDVVHNGMVQQKPIHFAQTCTYGSHPSYNFNFCLYFMSNKNDDSLHIELVKLDHAFGRQLRKKAELIIMADKPPSRLSDNPTFFACQYCAAKNVCHKNEAPEKNCRSCKHSKPTYDGEWFCDTHKAIIPKQVIPDGCPQYEAVG